MPPTNLQSTECSGGTELQNPKQNSDEVDSITTRAETMLDLLAILWTVGYMILNSVKSAIKPASYKAHD